MPHTASDLESAKKDLVAAEDRWERYDGNNPNKFRTQVSDARAKVHRIEVELKLSGVTQLSDHEMTESALDKLYPQANSKQIVEYNGDRYQRIFNPVSKSLSGKSVKEWHKSWKKLHQSQ